MVKIDDKNKAILKRSWFGKTNVLTLQMAADGRIFLHLGKKDAEKWLWKKCKFSTLECASILRVLEAKEQGWSTVHVFKGTNAGSVKIWVNRHDDKVVFKFDEFAKQLVPTEATEMGILMEETIREAARKMENITNFTDPK